MFTYTDLAYVANILGLDINNYYDSNGNITGHWLDVSVTMETDELTTEDYEWNNLPL